MKAPIGDLSGERMRFGQARGRRLAGIAAMTAGLAAAAAAVFWLPDSALKIAAAAAGGVISAAGFWLAARVDIVEVRIREGIVRRKRGFWPLVWSSAQNLSDFHRLELSAQAHSDAFGEAGILQTLRMTGTTGSIVLIDRRAGDSAGECAKEIAGLLGWPVPQVTTVAARERPLLERGVTFAAWGVMAALVIAAMWPGRSSSARPDSQRRVARLFSGSQTERGSLFARGVALYRGGDFVSAEAEFRKVLDQNPEDSDSLNMLAYALAEQQKLDDAMRTARKALAAAPRNWMIIDTVAEMHQRRREFKQAAEYYRRALRYAEPNMATETNCKYGETLLAMGQRPEAIAYLKRAAGRYEYPWSERAAEALLRLGVNPPRPGPRSSSPLQSPIEAQRF